MSYLEKLKAKISENAHPRLLTKPTKAPSVSSVSASGYHVLKKAPELVPQEHAQAHFPRSPTEVAPSHPDPLTPYYPCVVCGSTDRWEDRGIWRCVACWPRVASRTPQAPPHDA
jgi:hypothetical protein